VSGYIDIFYISSYPLEIQKYSILYYTNMGARCINCEDFNFNTIAEVLENVNPAYTVYKYLKGTVIKDDEERSDEVRLQIISSIDSNIEDSIT
jgi:hypothetical protein